MKPEDQYCLNENLMKTETEIMKNLNLHMDRSPNLVESHVISDKPRPPHFRKFITTSGVDPHAPKSDRIQQIRRKEYASQKRRNDIAQKRFLARHHKKNKKPASGTLSPLPGLSQRGPLKESHFFDMIDQIQKQNDQLVSQENLLNRQTEGHWFDSLSQKKQY